MGGRPGSTSPKPSPGSLPSGITPKASTHSFWVSSMSMVLTPLRVGVWAQSHPEASVGNKGVLCW